MSFLAPWLLLGLFAAAIPLLIHLRKAQRSRKIVFSTTRFFDEDFIRASRRAKVQDLLVMALRMALLALLALALAQPLIRSRRLAGLMTAGRARTVAIVLDNSASMGLISSQGRLLDRAKAGALALIDSLSPARGDRATVILAGWRDAGPIALLDGPTTDLDAARRAIRGVEQSDLAGDLTGAIHVAQSQLQDHGVTAGEVYVFSDLQESGLAPLDESTAVAAPVFFVATQAQPDAALDNLSVDAVQYGSARPMLGVPFTFRALVTNHGDQPRNQSVQLVIGDQVVAHRTVEVPARRGLLVRFVHRFSTPGWYTGRVELAGLADALEADNRRHFAVQVQQGVRIAAVSGAPSRLGPRDELFFFATALRVGADQDATIAIDQVAPEQLVKTLSGAVPDLLVLANVAALPDEALQAVERYVDGGGNLLITLGDRVDPAVYNTWTGAHRLHGGLLPGTLLTRVDQPDAGEPLSVADPAHPAFAAFDELGGVRVTGRYRIDASAGDVLLRTGSGDGVLIEKRFGRGAVVLWASSIDRDWTNFPVQPAFVPFVHRLVSYLAQPAMERSSFVRTGESIRLPTSATSPTAWLVVKPDEQIDYPQPTTDGLAFDATDRAGVYAVRRAADAEPEALFAANLPSDESAMVCLTEPELVSVAGDSGWSYIAAPESITVGGADITAQGFGLWDQLLILALLVGLFEPWIANRLSKRKLMRQSTTEPVTFRSPTARMQERPSPVEVSQA